MARVQFDRDDVLEKSTGLFWQNGFTGASMQQVFEVTGLKPGSVYLAFGSKDGLFRESLEQYANRSLKRIKHTLDNAPSVGKGICQILERMVAESANNDYCSCFLIKSQLELSANNRKLYQFAGSQLKKIENQYAKYLEKEPDCNKEEAHERATSLMLHIFGIRVYGYHEGAEGRMLKGLQKGLTWLPWSTR